MSDVLIFSGTTEGRELAEALADANVECDVCVATEYGVQTTRKSPLIHVRLGRLDADGMRALYRETRPKVVVDATHPYAALVSQTVRESLADTQIPLLRVLRPTLARSGGARYASSDECAAALAKTEGNILLTTGSKELAVFCADESVRSRIIARVLPSVESLQACVDAGLDGKQIVAMQGPFGKEANVALIRQYNIKHMVAKESGAPGGEDAKWRAAEETGVELHVVARPGEDAQETYDVAGALRRLESELGVTFRQGRVEVALVGVGCGARELMTEEARRAIADADYLFGAKRMLDAADSDAIAYPYYLQEDIVPILRKIRGERPGLTRVCALFSGDSGFYSGCEKLAAALRELEFVDLRVLPGVSSVSLLAARLGIAWHDAQVLSLHGVAPDGWEALLLDSARHNGKTFFLTSGAADVRRVGKLLETVPNFLASSRLWLGYNLSYPDEKVAEYAPENCKQITAPGLYVGAILNSAPEPRALAPDLSDAAFTRGDVPMTKEETRKLAVCALKLTPESVLYDVGAGTGSVAIQCALLAPGARVFAIERNPDAVALIEENAARLGARNVRTVTALAPDGLDALPPPTHAFIGGTQGNLIPILDKIYALNPKTRAVGTAATLESLAQWQAALDRYPAANVEVVQIAASRARKLGAYRLLQANNPVFLFAFDMVEK